MSNPIMSNETYKMYAERIAKRDRRLNNLVLLATTLEKLNEDNQLQRASSENSCRVKKVKRHGVTELACNAKTRTAVLHQQGRGVKRLTSNSSKENLYQNKNIIWEETTGELGEPHKLPAVGPTPAVTENRFNQESGPNEHTRSIENPGAFAVSTSVDVIDENSYVSIDYCNSCNSYGEVKHCCAVCNLNLCLDCMEIEGHMHATITLEKLEIVSSSVNSSQASFSSSWKSKAKVCLKSLVHASACTKTHCQLLGCLIMKAVISHMRTCARPPSKNCPTCERVVRLICEHSLGCKKFDYCPVPSCKLVRDNILNQLSQVAEKKVTVDHKELGVAALQKFNVNKLLKEEFIESLSVECIEVADSMIHNEQQSDVKRSELKICALQ